jgi:hypothetical protein
VVQPHLWFCLYERLFDFNLNTKTTLCEVATRYSDCLSSQGICCDEQSLGQVLCCGCPVRTLRIHLYVYSRHGGAQAYLIRRCDYVELRFNCLACGGLVINLCHVGFFSVVSSSVYWVLFWSGFRLFLVKLASSSSVLRVLLLQSDLTSTRTKLPIRIISR